MSMQDWVNKKDDEKPDDGPLPDPVKEERLRIDEMADLHTRISTLESGQVRLSRRVTRIEDGHKGAYTGDDPLSGILSPQVLWIIVLLTLAPLALEAWKEWKSSSS